MGNLASLSSSGNITTTGYFFGNGSQLAGIVSYSNVYVATYLPTYSGNVANLTVTATLAGPTITAINSSISVGNINMKNYVDGQITAANSAITSANLGLKGYVDNSVSTANIGMKGYVDAVASLSIYGNSNVKSYLTQFDGNLISNGNVAYNIGTDVNQWATVYANVVSAAYFIGNGALLTGISAGSNNYSNVNVKAYTESMGYQNFGNVNVAAVITTNGLTNYSNVNASALITTNGLTNYSNVNVIAYLAGNITVGNIAGSVNGFSIGYRDVPQITVANLTLIASDAGKHYYGANTNPTTITIPTNANVAFGNGTAISIVNQGTGNITVANAAGVLLYLAGNSTAGSRVITSYGMATLIKVQVNTWFINGTGVS